VSPDSSPALIIHLPAGSTAPSRDRLVALLADHNLVAIHEDDVSSARTWTAHFATADGRDAAARAIGALADPEPMRVEAADVEDEDWARRTQADLPAIKVGRIIVAPPWDLPSPAIAGDALVVEIEPSRGFGTGHHQSTRLCLVLLQSLPLDSRTVIDVGTGSGVLAIVAAKLGAAFVSALDVDPDAIDNARENIVRNRVDSIVEAHVRDLVEPGLPAADAATANLTGTLLARHAAALAALVKTGGSLIVAGFTADEKPLVLEAFEGAFALTQSAEEDDWWAFVLTRQGITFPGD
jgi:ribosomal protein L11 methyltransferase